MGRSISRVLSWAAIHLGSPSPRTSSDLPGSSAGHAIGSLFGLAPGGVYPATAVTSGAVRSYRTFSPLPAPEGTGGIFSAALAVATPSPVWPPGVTWHPALWSPDFPPAVSRQRLPDRPGRSIMDSVNSEQGIVNSCASSDRVSLKVPGRAQPQEALFPLFKEGSGTKPRIADKQGRFANRNASCFSLLPIHYSLLTASR